MTETRWYEIRGYEGLYEISEDKTQIRTCERRLDFGATLRVKQARSKKITDGRVKLRKNGNTKVIRVENIELGKESARNGEGWQPFPATTPEKDREYELKTFIGTDAVPVTGTFNGLLWTNAETGERLRSGDVKAFRTKRESN